MKKFKVGDRVTAIAPPDNDKSFVGKKGIIADAHGSRDLPYQVHFEDGRSWWCEEDVLRLTSDVTRSSTSKPKGVDTKVLDALVIAEDIKKEILSVLKQHTNHDKIFKKWGLEETIEYGKGMTFLFHGTPGTGKTWAATLMARALGTELLTIGMAEIQSSEPGAANRNIQQAFQSAKEGGKILFIDECDSLIYDRSQLGMVLGGEVNTLLQEIEKYEGVLILATNQVDRMDAALERRISLIVEFAKPNLEQRKAIWQKLIPTKLPLHQDVSSDTLAEHELTGGLIKNVILHAARMASANEEELVTNEHFDTAIKRVKASQNLMGTNKGPKARMVEDVGVGMSNNIQTNISSGSIDSFFKEIED
jgi:SpoVK/Ycf46/Vps4 family AAA+-type ATPase